MTTLRTGLAAVLALGLIALTAVPAGAQGTNGNAFQNWNFLGGGARARGMGGAYLSVSDDAYAGTWNPAGLVYNEGVAVSMNYSYSRVGLGLDYNAAGQALNPVDENSAISNLTAASFISPLTVMQKEFVVSVFYNRVQDVYTQSFFAADVDPVLGAPFTASYNMTGNIAAAGAAFGTTIYRRLTLGASLSLLTGDGREFFSADIDSTRDTSAFNQTTSWMNTSDLDYSGLSATIGALYRAEKWSAAVVMTPGYTLTQSVDFYAQRVTVHNLIPTKSRPVYGPLQGTKREIDIPYTVGLAGSYKLSDNFLVAADYQYRAFKSQDRYIETGVSNYRIQESPTEPDARFDEIEVAWYNLHQVRLGAEYRREMSFGVVPIRLGLRNDPLVVGEIVDNTVRLDERIEATKSVPDYSYFSLYNKANGTGSQVNAWTFTLGSGVHWSQVRLDAAVELTSYSYEEVGSIYSIQRCPSCLTTDPGVTVDEWGKRKEFYWGDYKRTYDNSKVRFLVNFTGYF